jgi:hypothetical protein
VFRREWLSGFVASVAESDSGFESTPRLFVFWKFQIKGKIMNLKAYAEKIKIGMTRGELDEVMAPCQKWVKSQFISPIGIEYVWRQRRWLICETTVSVVVDPTNKVSYIHVY